MYHEIADNYEGTDDLVMWAKARRKTVLFQDPEEAVQKAVVQISAHVQANYPQQQVEAFLRGADPWLIAHAMVDGGVVVTLEKGSRGKIKIPDLCNVFGVRAVSLYTMLRELNIVFGASSTGKTTS